MSTDTVREESAWTKQLINCHTHIFTGDHVPPWLAKKFIPWPFYLLLPLSLIVGLFRWYYTVLYPSRFKPWYKKIARLLNGWKAFLARYHVLLLLKTITGLFLTLQGFFILYDWVKKLAGAGNTQWIGRIDKAGDWLHQQHVLLPISSLFWQLIIVIFVLLFIPSGRNLILFMANKVWGFMGKLPGKQTKELISRYLTIGRHAFHTQQSRTFGMLKNQYPAGSGFVILPMDMEYMEAGPLKPAFRYRQQMTELASLKKHNPDTCFPFVFADPRRFVPVEKEINAVEGDLPYFEYEIAKTGNGHQVVLGHCFIRQLIEEEKFNGFKIYPALGYYPFDLKLLPLWKYAADRGLPILTHCIRGTIFFRGRKQSDWYQHPVFEEFAGRDADGQEYFKPLILPQRKNEVFSVNFTHPMNYLCLLEEPLLRQLVAHSGDEKLKTLFGYTDKNTALVADLRHLKICLGHFGGDDEWKNFLEKDRDQFSSKLNEFPGKGVDFFHDAAGNISKTKTEQLWKGADWYTIICSMMLQYPNVYADLSYILHDDDLIIPLLTQTLQNPHLRTRVLFGTDFFVVRNHKSDKELLGDMMAGLSEADFNVIARENPAGFLKTNT